MNNFLSYFFPLTTIANLLLLVVWAYKCRAKVSLLFQGAGKKVFYALLGIFCFSLFVRLLWIIPRHRLYNDEFYYMLTAKNFLLHANFALGYKAFGWSLIMAVVFAVFGISNYAAIGASIFFGALTVFNIFLIIYLIFKDKKLSLLCAAVFGMMPAHILWSATAETSVVSIFFVTFCLWVLLLYFQKPDKGLLWLSLMGISFAFQIRAENFALFILFVAGSRIFLKRWPDFREEAWFFSGCLCLPGIILISRHYYGEILHPRSPSQWLVRDMIDNFAGFFDGRLFPFLFVLLAVAGFIYLWFRNRSCNLFIFLWFLVFAPVYFYWVSDMGAGPLTLLNKARYYICLFPLLMVWFAAGISFVLAQVKSAGKRNAVFLLLCAALVFSFLPYFRIKYNNTSDGRILETMILGSIGSQWPSQCLVVTNYPEVLQSVTDIQTVDINKFLRDRSFQKSILDQNECVLFFEDYFCSATDPVDQCQQMKRAFFLKPFRRYSLKGEADAPVYTLYRIYREEPAGCAEP